MTVNTVELLIVPDDACMVDCPGVSALARPILLIVATPKVEEDHVAVLLRFCVLLSV